ncbi:MAG: glycosyltransferase [Bacteroidales bacterium]|jgi:glycosyltransferase involved in cell wall biosynthesis
MKILIVVSGNSGELTPFVKEQADSLAIGYDLKFNYFFIVGKGIRGYLKNFNKLRNKISSYRPGLIHAHYGLSGLLAVLAKKSDPVIVTFHGNDINTLHPLGRFQPNWNRIISRAVYKMSNHSLFVTKDLANQIKAKPVKSDIIPCQVNLDTFYPVDKSEARMKMNLSMTKKYVLFSSSFKIPIKNYPLAKRTCSHFDDLELIELSGFSRPEVNLLLNACDLALLTSYNEGSNQFIKEAMACNRPIVSTDVGDVRWIFGNTEGCYLTSFDVQDVINNVEKALEFSEKTGSTKGRERIIELGLDAETTARKIMGVYKKVLKIKD